MMKKWFDGPTPSSQLEVRLPVCLVVCGCCSRLLQRSFLCRLFCRTKVSTSAFSCSASCCPGCLCPDVVTGRTLTYLTEGPKSCVNKASDNRNAHNTSSLIAVCFVR